MSVLGALRGLFGSVGPAAKSAIVPAQPVHHPILGDLEPDKTFPDTLVGEIPSESGLIKISIAPDGDPIEAAIALAVATVACVRELDAKSRRLIAAESLESYNTNWRFGEVALPNGQTEPLNKPALSAAEFCEVLKFEAIVVSGPSTLIFWYGDNEMFCGHSLYVTSFDGLAMEDAHVSMFG